MPSCVRIMLRDGMTQDGIYVNAQDSFSCTEMREEERASLCSPLTSQCQKSGILETQKRIVQVFLTNWRIIGHADENRLG